MVSPNLGEIATTSLQNYSKKLADNITNHNPLLFRIDKAGNRRTVTGRTILQEMEYAENGTVKWYSGYEVLDTSNAQVLTSAEFDYKQIAGNVTFSGLEGIQNSGSEAIHNLLQSRIKVLEKSLKNTVALALFADGTGTSGKEIGGFQLLIADDPTTGTVGGINRATHAFYRNQLYDFSVTAGTAASSTNIQTAMNTLYVNCVRNEDHPDFIVMDTSYFVFFWDALTQIQRIQQAGVGEAGFESLKFRGADVFFDSNAPASHAYFVNTDYVHFCVAKGRNFVPLADRQSINQDAFVMPVVWAGNCTLSNAELQGVMHE